MTSYQPTPRPRLLRSAIAVATMLLAHGATAQNLSTQDAAPQRVEVTGSSIKRLATENALDRKSVV